MPKITRSKFMSKGKYCWIQAFCAFCFWMHAISAFAADVERPELGFIVFGGYLSCPLKGDPGDMILTDAFYSAYEDSVGKRVKPEFTYLACFSTDPKKVHIRRSNEPGQIFLVGLNELFSDINAWLESVPRSHQLHVIAMSYGAATMIRYLQVMDGTSRSRLGHLVTIDGIDPGGCTPDKVVFLSMGIGSANEHHPCTKAPEFWRDFIFPGLSWLNFYQQDSVLHSSMTPNADENHLISYQGTAKGPLGHHWIQSDSYVWSYLSKRIFP